MEHVFRRYAIYLVRSDDIVDRQLVNRLSQPGGHRLDLLKKKLECEAEISGNDVGKIRLFMKTGSAIERVIDHFSTTIENVLPEVENFHELMGIAHHLKAIINGDSPYADTLIFFTFVEDTGTVSKFFEKLGEWGSLFGFQNPIPRPHVTNILAIGVEIPDRRIWFLTLAESTATQDSPRT